MRKSAVLAALCLVLAACSGDPSCSVTAQQGNLVHGAQLLQSGDSDPAIVTDQMAADKAAQCAAADRDAAKNAQDRMFEVAALGQAIHAMTVTRRENYDPDQTALLQKRITIETGLANDDGANVPDVALGDEPKTIKQNAEKFASADSALLKKAKRLASKDQYIQLEQQASGH